jgi:branched-chain amino acid transport system permease protein
VPENLQILFEAPVLSWQIIIDGLLLGAVFALAAYGMALTWGVMNIINVAQGEFVMLGGFVTILLGDAGANPLLSVPVAAVVLFLLGWALYRTVIFRIVDRDLFASLLATFGISILLQQLANELFGADVRTAESGLGTVMLADGMITIPQIKLVSFVVALLLGVALYLFLKRSRMGRAIRATAQNPRAARIVGIETDRVYAMTYALNAAICGAAGGLVAMTWVVHPYLGLAFTIRSFMIVIVAGLGNLIGVAAAGLGLGAAENIAGFLLGTEFQSAFVFSLLVVILVVRNTVLSLRRRYLR